MPKERPVFFEDWIRCPECDKCLPLYKNKWGPWANELRKVGRGEGFDFGWEWETYQNPVTLKWVCLECANHKTLGVE